MEVRLAGVTEGRVADVVSETGGLDEVGIDEALGAEIRAGRLEPGTEAAADLRDLDGMRQPGPVEIVFAGEEDLGLALEPRKAEVWMMRSRSIWKAVRKSSGSFRARSGARGRDIEFAVERVWHREKGAGNQKGGGWRFEQGISTGAGLKSGRVFPDLPFRGRSRPNWRRRALIGFGLTH